MTRMIEAMAARYGQPPWEVAVLPVYIIREWYDAALENIRTEGMLFFGGALELIMKAK